MCRAWAGSRRGRWEEPPVLHGFFYHVFAAKGHGGYASFLLASMNYLDFQGIFLIHKKAIFKYREKATRGTTLWDFAKLFVGSARGRALALIFLCAK